MVSGVWKKWAFFLHIAPIILVEKFAGAIMASNIAADVRSIRSIEGLLANPYSSAITSLPISSQIMLCCCFWLKIAYAIPCVYQPFWKYNWNCGADRTDGITCTTVSWKVVSKPDCSFIQNTQWHRHIEQNYPTADFTWLTDFLRLTWTLIGRHPNRST